MKNYVLKNAKVMAVQFTGENRREIARTLSLESDQCQMWVNQDTKECYLLVEAPGKMMGKIGVKQWVVCCNSGTNPYLVKADEEFKMIYEEIP